MELSALKKSYDAIYSKHLPKGGHYFACLSIEMKPDTIDVNVHPTKKQVQFLHQDAIIDLLGQELEQALQNTNQSRTFYIQVRLDSSLTFISRKLFLLQVVVSHH